MKTIKTLKLSSFFLFILIATQSCMVSSLHPLYTNKEIIHKEELNGKWQTNDETIIEITTVTDSIGLETSSKEDHFFMGIDQKKKEEQPISSTKKSSNKDSKMKSTLSKEERFFMGLDQKKKKEQSISSTNKNAKKKDTLSKEERFFMGLDHKKQDIQPGIKNKMKLHICPKIMRQKQTLN